METRPPAEAPETGAHEERPPRPSDRVRTEWTRRGRSEYISAALAHHFSLWLIQLGVSPDLINAGLDVVEDELRHAEMCRALVTLAGGGDLPKIEQDRLELPHEPDEPLAARTLRACVASFCLDETMAVPLFTEMRARTRVPQVRATAAAFLSDEVHHRELGWVTLEWLLRGPDGDALRPLAAQEFEAALKVRRPMFLDPRMFTPDARPRPDDVAWGCMPPEVFVEVYRRTLVRVIEPRMRALELALPAGLTADIEREADALLGSGAG